MRPSIITLTKNRTNHLKNLCKGLLFQKNDFLELVVVVMGGEDPCDDKEFKDLQNAIPTKIVYLYDIGLPLAKARNLGAESASSSELIFLDVDCVPGSNMAQEYSEILKAWPKSLIMGQVRYLEKGHLNKHALPLREDSGAPHPSRNYKGTKIDERYELFWSLSFACSKDVYNKIGGFDEGFMGYGGEDTDFAFSAHLANISLVSSDRPIAFHQFHETCEPPLNHFKDIIKNASYFQKKWQRPCMDGWLRRFMEMGLIDENQKILRLPTKLELHSAAKS